MRTAVAFLVAIAVVSALAPLAVGGDLDFYPPYFILWFLPVVGFFTLGVALPIYAALPKRYKAKLLPLVAAGFVAAAASFLLLETLFISTSFEKLGDDVLVRDGWHTAAGWRLLLKHALLLGCAGAVGGAVVWAVRRLTIVGGIRVRPS